MTSARRARPARTTETGLLRVAAAHLTAQGYRTYLDPDGSSYFDLAAVRGAELGLVEGKVGDPRTVLRQAVRRRAWADWVAVVVDSPRSAERLVARTAELRAAKVGVWTVEGERLLELRPPGRWPTPEDDPFAPLRRRLRAALEAIARGETPEGVGWSGVPAEVRRVSGGRRFAEWRLDEIAD